MQRLPEHDELDDALRRCGVTWNASQAHGFLCSRVALHGSEAASDWLDQVLAGAEPNNRSRDGCVRMLESLFNTTWRQLAEGQSEFTALLPDDAAPAAGRADALAHWCEGFLHGLVSGPHPQSLRTRLAAEPLSGIIRDLLEITRATAASPDEPDDDNGNEEAYIQLVEYIRVAAQLTYEELAGSA
ncbi:MAG: YecA family protein [Woeseia sp.]